MKEKSHCAPTSPEELGCFFLMDSATDSPLGPYHCIMASLFFFMCMCLICAIVASQLHGHNDPLRIKMKN